MGMQEPRLSVQAKIFTGSNTFQDVINKNPDFNDWTPAEKNEVADMFFKEKYSDFTPQEQVEARTIFNKKYNVGHVGLDDNVADDPASKALIPIQRLGDLATLGIPARAWDAANFGGTNAGDERDAQLSSYAADPGLYGDLYRASQSGIVKGIGGLAGSLKSTAGIVGNTAKSGLAGLLSTAGNNPVLKPWLGNAQKAAFTAGGAAYSGISNALATLQGQQNPLEGLLSTGVDVATLPLGGKTRLGNATVQSIAGGAQSLLSDAIHGLPLNIQKAIEEALLQGGVGAAFPESHQQNGPKVRKLNSAQSIGIKAPGRPKNVRTQAGQLADVMQSSVQDQLNLAARHQSVTEAKTLKAKIDALRKQYESLSQTANHPMSPPVVKQNAKAMQARILEVHNQLSKQYQQQFGKTPAREKQNLDHAGSDFQNVVGLVKDMRAKGNVKQANHMLNAFTPETKAKIFDEVHRQEQAEKKAQPKAAKPAAPQKGTPVGDVLLDALKKAAEKPVYKGEVKSEYQAPGADEYTRMARDNGVTKSTIAKAEGGGKTITAKATKKGKTSPKEKVQSDAKKKAAEREETVKTFQVLSRNSDWSEQPATDFLSRHGIPYKKLKKGSVLHYGIWVGRKGTIAFKYNEPIGSLLGKTGLDAMASKVNSKSSLEALRAEMHDLEFNEDNYSGDPHDLVRLQEDKALDEYNARDAEENAYYARVEHNEAQFLNALENVKSFDELADIFDRLESEKYQDMPPEFFDRMFEAYQQHVERVENGKKPGSTKPEGSAGENPQDAGRGQGQAGEESRQFGKITEKDLMPIEKMRQIRKEAVANGETVRIRYWAERTGETSTFHYKTLHDVRVIEGKNGKETKWTGINSDGQLHTYIERNNAGNLQDSNIISVERTGQKSEFRRALHPDTGSLAVEHIESGELIPQIQKKGVKSSTLHAKMDELITAVNEGKHVSVDRILNTAREFSKHKELEAHLESMSQEERAKLYQQETGRPC